MDSLIRKPQMTAACNGFPMVMHSKSKDRQRVHWRCARSSCPGRAVSSMTRYYRSLTQTDGHNHEPKEEEALEPTSEMLVETSSSTDALELLTELKCAGLEATSDLTRGTKAESIVILSDDGSTPSEESSRNADDYALSNLPSDGLDPLALMDVLSKGLSSGSRSGEGQAESSKAESSDRNPNTRVRHPIWELFVVTDACVRCKECGAELCLPPSTTVAKRHLRAKHPRLMQQVEKREVDWYPKQPAMKRLRRDVLQELAKEGASLVYPTSARHVAYNRLK